jgi:hypothetical protein
MFSANPCLSKGEFLAGIDTLVATLKLHEYEYQRANAPYSTNTFTALPVMGCR